MIAIRLMSPQGMMAKEEQLKKLQQLVQTAIYTQSFLDIEPTDLPKYVSAFSFEINPVNHPNFFIILSLAHGMEAQWYERLDHIGLRWLMDDVYSNFKPDAQGKQLPKSLEWWIDLGERLGLLTHSSSSVKVDGKYGRSIAVAYAATVKGLEAPIDFVNEFKGKILTLCSGLKVSFQCFLSHNQSKGQRKQNEPIYNFARTTILSNNHHCTKHFKEVLIDCLTSAIADKATQINMIVAYKHLEAVVAKIVKLPKKPDHAYNYRYAAQWILECSASTIGCESAFSANFSKAV